MKKFFVYLLLVFFINLFIPLNVFAKTQDKYKYKDIKDTDLQIVMKDKHSKKALINKKTNEQILPFAYYKKIKKVKFQNKIIISADTLNEVILYSPDGLFEDFFEKYISTNNYLQNIKFENYPKHVAIKYKKGDKYGLIIPDGNKIHILLPVHRNYEFLDGNSIASRMLNFTTSENIIEYGNKPENKRLFTEYGIQGTIYVYSEFYVPYNIEEEITIKDGVLNVVNKNISQINKDKILVRESDKFYLKLKSGEKEYKNIKVPDKKEIRNFVLNAESLEEIYNYIKNTTNFEFVNYPKNAMIQINNKIYIFENGNKYVYEISNNMDNDNNCVYFHDRNSIFTKVTGINISFQKLNNIIYKKEKWGIVDKNGNIKVPFEYDGIYPQGSNIKEQIKNIDNLNADKLVIEYLGQSKDSGLFLAKKGYNYGVINDKNEIIYPFEIAKFMEFDDFNLLKKEINKKIRRDENSGRRDSIQHFFIYTLPLTLFTIVLFPFAIVCPPIGLALMMGLVIN